ncbi:MAG: NUDIX domain-containing protein [Thermomicrobiales bacterium]
MVQAEGRIKIVSQEVLADDWGTLKKWTFAYRRADGTWETQRRETYDRGDGAVVLLCNRARRSVILTRQFRLPAYVNGHGGMLIEACAGLLDADDPEACVVRETREETGYLIAAPRRIFDAFMSPGSVTERLAFFVAEYEPSARREAGGGVGDEEIEVLEILLDDALGMIGRGEIVDAKTIMLLYHAKVHRLVE